MLLPEGYFENLYSRFLEESMLFLLASNCPAGTQSLRTSPSGPTLVETSRTIPGLK